MSFFLCFGICTFRCNLKEGESLYFSFSPSLLPCSLPFIFSFLYQVGTELSFAVTTSELLVCKEALWASFPATSYSSPLQAWTAVFIGLLPVDRFNFPLYTRSISALYLEKTMRLQRYFNWKLINWTIIDHI